MATKRVIDDADFGKIIVRTNRRARNVSMRVKSDGLYVTVPPYTLTSRLMEVIGEYRSQLLESWVKVRKQPLNLDFTLQKPCFHLRLAQGNMRFFTIRQIDDEICIFCPPYADFEDENVQRLLRNAIVRAMKKVAEAYLSPLLKALAEQYGFTYRKVRINGSRGRWGSCSAAGSINLSCYLMLLPPHLMDYVLLHELCHTREMNHGPKFWEQMDLVTSGLALQLRRELRQYHTDF